MAIEHELYDDGVKITLVVPEHDGTPGDTVAFPRPLVDGEILTKGEAYTQWRQNTEEAIAAILARHEKAEEPSTEPERGKRVRAVR